ncbi:stomatin-like protein stl-1 [Mytilus edulis]|uniref:stomatin-like protein stl-1 n=1 Tax=Mytilus edulis TaxID=6550 RepID=UPI0039EF4479
MFKTPSIRSARLIKLMVNHASRRHITGRGGTPINTIIVFVPQQEAWVVERFGKYARILEPGINFLAPIVHKVAYVQSLKELAIDVPQQAAITMDNVTLNLDGVLYLRVTDPHKASYGVEDAEFAITQLAQTTMRSEIGKIALDTVFRERETLNVNIVEALNKAAEAWGITCLRYEIRDMKLPKKIQEAMQMQVEAERKKRAYILESEGQREADINVAEGQKKAKILNSEAFKLEQINNAEGEANAILAKAKAKADAINVVAQAITSKNGVNAVSYNVAEQYVSAFSNLAQKGNTVLLPANTGDVSSMVSQAMAIYTNLSEANKVKQTLSETEEVKEKQQIEPTNINVNPESWDTDTHTLFSSELDSPDKQN